MPIPKKMQGTAIARTAEHQNLPFNDRSKSLKAVIPHDIWVGARLIDTEEGMHKDGMPTNVMTFEVTNPRLYAGAQLRLVMSEKLSKSLDTTNPASLASNFPGVDLLSADATWHALNGVPLRVHVGQTTYTDTATGEVKVGHRVAGFRIDERARV